MYRFFIIFTSCIYSFLNINLAEALSTGTLQFAKSQKIAIIRQDVDISSSSVRISYVLENQSPIMLYETLVFPMPSTDEEQDINDLEILVNGQTVDLRKKTLPVNLHGSEVSSILSDYNLDYDPKIAKEQILKSPNKDFIVDSLSNLNLYNTALSRPLWIKREYNYFLQQFSPDKQVQIKISYEPKIKTTNFKHIFQNENVIKKISKNTKNLFQAKSSRHKSQEMLDEYYPQIARHCPTPKDLGIIVKTIDNKNKMHTVLHGKTINLELMQDSGWGGPIKNFTLKINKQLTEYPILCWPNHPSRESVDAIIYEAENFIPLNDISVLYLD